MGCVGAVGPIVVGVVAGRVGVPWGVVGGSVGTSAVWASVAVCVAKVELSE